MGSVTEPITGAIAEVVELAAVAAVGHYKSAVADVGHYKSADAATAVAEAEPEHRPGFLENSAQKHFENGTAVTSASESKKQTHWTHIETVGTAEEIGRLIWKNQLFSFPEVQQLPLLGIHPVVNLA